MGSNTEDIYVNIACSLGTGPRVGANSEDIYIACSLGTGPRVGSNTEDICSLV